MFSVEAYASLICTPSQLDVGAVIDHVGHAGLEEQRQERAGQQQDDERVEGDLAEQERPVVGEDFLRKDLNALGAVEPVVQPAARCRPAPVDAHVDGPRSQKLGPTGSVKSLPGHQEALRVHGRSAAAAAAWSPDRRSPARHASRRTSTGDTGRGCGASSARTSAAGQPTCVQILEYATMLSTVQFCTTLPGTGVDRVGELQSRSART